MDASALLADTRIVPVVVISDIDTAIPLALTLRDAGIRAIEITLRTPQALRALECISREVPELLPGVGSVRQPEQFAQAREAGARFAVSPGTTPTLLQAAGTARMPYLPGAATASEILHLLEAGYRLQKFFPAEQLGGIRMLKALGAPLPEARFCPTGGLHAGLVPAYLDCPQVACVGGSWFIPAEALAAGDYARIGELATAAVALASTA